MPALVTFAMALLLLLGWSALVAGDSTRGISLATAHGLYSRPHSVDQFDPDEWQRFAVSSFRHDAGDSTNLHAMRRPRESFDQPWAEAMSQRLTEVRGLPTTPAGLKGTGAPESADATWCVSQSHDITWCRVCFPPGIQEKTWITRVA